MIGYNPYYSGNMMTDPEEQNALAWNRSLPDLYKYPGAPKQLPQVPQINPNTSQRPGTTPISSERLGGIMGAVNTGLGMYNENAQEVAAVKSIDTSAPQSQVDAYGRPVWNAGGMLNTIGGIDTGLNSAGKVGASTARGAITGAQLGGPIGGAIGGIIGAASSIIGGHVRRNAAKRAKRRAIRNFKGVQTSYNNNTLAANQQEAANSQYTDLMNNQTRYNNLYSIGTNLY
jgi:hypothetical protein